MLIKSLILIQENVETIAVPGGKDVKENKNSGYSEI